MTTASAIASFVRRPIITPSADYWLHIEQVLPAGDSASKGEVAELVDAIWGTNPCLQPEDPAAATDQESEATAPVDEAQFAAIVKDLFPPRICGANVTGDYPTQIKVAIAHPGEDYTLRLTNGRITRTVTVEEQISRTIVVQNAASFDLDFPIVAGGTFAWRGSVWGNGGNGAGPKIVSSGRALAWGQPVTGTMTVSYRTRYDLVDVIVFGDLEGEPGECRAICFYHGLVDAIDLEAPAIEDDDNLDTYRQQYCPSTRWDFVWPENYVTCYEDVSYVIKCQCSGYELGQFTEYRVEVPCPPGIRCQGVWEVCDHFIGHRTVLWGYVDCGETSGNLDDPEYRNTVCCDNYQPLPKCLETYRKNPGGVSLPPEVEQELRDTYGDRLRLVPVSPDDGDCGITTTTIEVDPKNCCDVATPIVWDDAVSVEVMAPNTNGIIGVTGGLRPLHWSVRGDDMTLDGYSLRDGFTDTGYTRLYAGTNSCGTCYITVTDGCTEITVAVRCVGGVWVEDMTQHYGTLTTPEYIIREGADWKRVEYWCSQDSRNAESCADNCAADPQPGDCYLPCSPAEDSTCYHPSGGAAYTVNCGCRGIRHYFWRCS